jgi:hypothetical protein
MNSWASRERSGILATTDAQVGVPVIAGFENVGPDVVGTGRVVVAVAAVVGRVVLTAPGAGMATAPCAVIRGPHATSDTAAAQTTAVCSVRLPLPVGPPCPRMRIGHTIGRRGPRGNHPDGGSACHPSV